MPEAGIIWATGRRKSAVARVRMKPGSGQTIVNGRPMTEYFPREVLHMRIQNPFEVSANEGRWDVIATIHGGGVSGQADALRHGISRALLDFNGELRERLKTAGLLTRDARVKERKKYGQKGARARFQFSKR